MGEKDNAFQIIYQKLLDYYGRQHWWPAEDEFEVMIGAILTQNTNWSNVEKAIEQLKQNDLCDAGRLASADEDILGQVIRSSGYYNQKAQRLRRFARWYLKQGGLSALREQDLHELREGLISLNGIGDETADDMVLYAFDKPSFIIDAYTRRIFSRLGMLEEKDSYRKLQQQFHQALETDVDLFKQYHALIVSHAKQHCQKKPGCEACPLSSNCHYHGSQTH